MYKLHIFFFCIAFILVFLVTYITDLLRIKKKKKNKIGELNYLISKFKLDKNKLKYKTDCFVIAIINAFIIATTTTVITAVDVHMSIQLLVGFVILFSLIYSVFEIYGRHLKRREERLIKKEKINKKEKNNEKTNKTKKKGKK